MARKRLTGLKAKKPLIGGSTRTKLVGKSVRTRDKRMEMADDVYLHLKGDEEVLYVQFSIIPEENVLLIEQAESNSKNSFKVNEDGNYRTCYCKAVIASLGEELGDKITKALVFSGELDIYEDEDVRYAEFKYR
ncbi:hypothetical protein RJG79_10615 [Mycoplasmatota bacterium WC44]